MNVKAFQESMNKVIFSIRKNIRAFTYICGMHASSVSAPAMYGLDRSIVYFYLFYFFCLVLDKHLKMNGITSFSFILHLDLGNCRPEPLHSLSVTNGLHLMQGALSLAPIFCLFGTITHRAQWVLPEHVKTIER